MSFRFKNIALAALCCVLTTGLRAWAADRINPVTGETETYANVFYAGTEWNDAANWDTSKTPFITGNHDPALVDGNAVSTSTAIDGYQLRVGAYNGASVTWSGGITKIQGSTTGCWLTADETSSITISSFAGNQLENNGNNVVFKLTSANAGGITWSSGLSSNSGYQNLEFHYFLGGSGTVVYGGDITVANAQVIKQADITLSGGAKSVKSKTLITFGSGTTKTFLADATIKRLNSSGTDLGRDTHLSIMHGETTLTKSSGVGRCELVQTSTGVELYWVDGDPMDLVDEAYLPSISVNFTSGTDLSTAADVGFGEYAIPGTSWNNLIGNNGSLETVTCVDTNGVVSATGARVTISGTRGYWTRDGLDAASELRQGYIDDSAGNASPTIVVEGIPYCNYRVVIICSSDYNATKFGYMTVNGTHYKGDGFKTVTCSGGDSDVWGSASDTTWIEGGNFLVTPAIVNTDGNLTIVSHRLSNSRAGLAAIQVVEVKPEVGENDLEITVSGDTVHPVSEAKELSGTVYLTGSGTLTLSGSAKITAASINVGKNVTLNVNTNRLDATAFTGEGTVVYGGFTPPSGKGWDNPIWSGTLRVSNVAWAGVTFSAYGNKGSTLELSGVTGYFNERSGQATDTIIPTLKLTDGTGDFAFGFKSNNGWSSDYATIRKLVGTGKLIGVNNANGYNITQHYLIQDGSEFTGSIDTGCRSIAFGSTTEKTADKIVVDAGQDISIASGKSWSSSIGNLSVEVKGRLNNSGSIFPHGGISVGATGHIANYYEIGSVSASMTIAQGGSVETFADVGIWLGGGINVNGALTAANLDKFGGGTNISIGDNGVLTLVTDGNITSDGDFARIQGAGTLRYEGSGSRTLTTINFPTGLICENNLSAGLILTSAGGTIGSLAGTGVIRPDAGCANCGLRIVQSKDTTYSGLFDSGADNIGIVTVAPGASASGTLTLSGVETTSTALEVESGAKVNITGTWVGAATVAGTISGTGRIDGDLIFSAGSTLLKASAASEGLTVTGSLTYPADDSKIKVGVSGLDLDNESFVLLLSGLTYADTEKFELADTSITDFKFMFAGGELALVRSSDYRNVYRDYVTFTLNGIGATPIANYTLLVRISESQLPGFMYERVGNKSQIAFSDGHGNALSYEIDTWNPHGESLIWVKIPSAVDGDKITFYWSLKDGQTAPENDSGEVWSAYAGVWHMNDETDSTTNKTSGSVGKVASPQEGKLGNALGAYTQGSALLTATQNDAINSLTGGVFSVSMWVKLNSVDGGPFLFSRATENGLPGYGWSIYSGDPSRIISYYGGAVGNRFTKYLSTPIPLNRWARIDVFYGGTTAQLWLDGTNVLSVTGIEVPVLNGSGDFAIGGFLGEQTSGTVNGAIDEFRMRAGGIEASRLAAEIANASFKNYLTATIEDGSFLVPSIVRRDGIGVDYWLKSPTISHSYWSTTAVPAVVYTAGVLRSGSSVTNWCENLLTGEKCDVSFDTLRALPAGTYRIHCETRGGFAVAEKTVDFTIVEESGITSVGDTASGRILLMNNDFSQGDGASATSPSIAYQGYSETNTEASVYWEFLDRDGSSMSTMNIMDGKNSILWSVSDDKSVTNKLWQLVNCRHGNTFPAGGAGFSDNQNYLPYSDASCKMTDGKAAVESCADAGQLLMLNTTDAAVYSPCYEEGIGTIYFDAVNGWNNNLYSYDVTEGDTNAYQIIVEYATKATDGSSVTDENLDTTVWQACKSHVIRVTGGNTLLAPETFNGEFGLAVEAGRPTTTGEFYRVYADLDIRVPARFRIRRVSIDSDAGAADANAYVILDNIIVSYPGMGATLESPGWYDPDKKGDSVLGFESAFTSPFPAVGEAVRGRAVANYYVNSFTNLTETNFFASAKMYYRWRYLNQPSPDGWEWKSVALDPEQDFCSSKDLVLPKEVGDVEFWYEYTLQAPYYSYHDYSGLNLAPDLSAIYSEAIMGPQTNRSTKTGFSYPTGGNDWFVRIRPAVSSNEVWRIYMRNVDGSFYDADGKGSDHVDFAVMESGSWRGFVRTPNPVAAGLEYRIEQVNPQTDVENFTFSTNYWKGSAEITGNIKSIALAKAVSADEWSAVPCAGSTSYLMFVIDETSPVLSVTSADRQDFNNWNDANKNEILFVGSSSEDGDSKKAGVSPGMHVYDANFEDWAPCIATNGYWKESFVENWTRYVKFVAETNTPNGWTSGRGMWIYEKYKDDSNAQSMALQMQGRGEGYLAFTGAVEDPRGFESISFRSRIAQSVSLDDFAYRDEGVGKSYTNYTFVVQAAMSTNIASDASWDSRFDGLGQISVIGGYRDNRGGYELRITRWKETRYRAELYKWVGNTPEVVNSCEAFLSYARMPYTIINDGSGEKYPTLYMSVSYQADGSCKVQAGFSCEAGGTTNGHSAPNELPSTGNYINLAFWDDSPPTKYGSYGVTSANCDAVFTGARFCNKPAEWLATSLGKGMKNSGYVKKGCSEYTPGDGAPLVAEDIDEDWSRPARFKYDTAAEKLRAVADAQPLLVQWRRPTEGDSDWKTLDTVTVSSYTLSKLNTIKLLLKEDAYIRLKHGGDSSDDSNCVDIVVDDVTLRQWRGDDYFNEDTQTSFDNLRQASPSNFVFTSAWIHEEGSVELSTARTLTDAVSSLRSPLMDGLAGRGIGLGMFSFSYTNADSRASLLLQIATDVETATLSDYTSALADSTLWTTVTNFDFSVLSDEERAGGVMAYYLGMHGVKGVMRLVVNPESIAAAEASGDPEYGRVFVTDAICRDEPNLDATSWWGWNLRTGRGLYATYDKLLMNLSDWSGSGLAAAGMSLALNNSTVEDTSTIDSTTYLQHQPFVQTPTFTNGTTVGEISLKARRYDMPSEITARVCVYGANPLSEHVDTSIDKNWKYVTHFDVTNDYYQTYSFKASPDKSYEVLRLVVVGVTGVVQEHGKHSDPGYDDDKPVVRVAIDDVVVTEALRAKLAFRNVFAFRSDGLTDLVNTHYVNRFGDKTAQPLAGEGWGVQAEVYAEQLPDEIDFDRGVSVKLYWYDGSILTWGADKWLTEENSAKLAPCDDKDLVFRSSYSDGNSGRSVLGQMSEYKGGTVVQYMLRVEYYLKGSEVPTHNDMTQEQWVKPHWYSGIDYNEDYEGFAGYTILDTVSPGWAWINEVNVFGGYDSSYNNADADRQYVEIAMPVEADLTGWTLEFISKTTTNKVCRFGANGVPGRKKTNSSENCAFLVISSPTSKSNLEATTVGGKPVVVDGTWTIENTDGWNFLYNDRIDVQLDPIGVQLVRSSGIVEHAITFEGTNLFGSVENSAADFAASLNAKTPGANWVAVGDDSIEGDHSLGVTNSPANLVANWSNTISRTPGFINDNQKINPDHPIANGVSYIIYATLAEDSAGHMTQSLGNDIKTTSLAMAVVPKGTATNITYDVENWYELDSVKVNGDPLSLSARTGKVDIILGGEATSNNLTVVAASRVNPVLAEDYELTTDNRYTSAVVDWLNKGVRMDGTPFEHPEGPIKAAAYCEINGTVVTNLTLTEMYWLDIDPTEGDWKLVAGMIDPPVPVEVKPSYAAGDPLTNLRMGVYMCLTNTATTKSFSPYVLRGVAPGSLSTNYTSDVENTWDGPTFRILGRLYNAVVSGGDEEYFDWVALRWFVFNEDSFGAKGSSVAHQSTIDIRDPYSQNSPAYIERWDKWKGNSNVYFKWSIEGDTTLFTPQTLCPTNWISY